MHFKLLTLAKRPKNIKVEIKSQKLIIKAKSQKK